MTGVQTCAIPISTHYTLPTTYFVCLSPPSFSTSTSTSTSTAHAPETTVSLSICPSFFTSAPRPGLAHTVFPDFTRARTTTTQVFKLCPEAFTFPAACVIASATSQRPRPHIVFCRCRITTRHLRSIANPSLGSSEKRLRAGRSRHTSPDIPAPTPADHLSAALPPGILSALLALPVRL